MTPRLIIGVEKNYDWGDDTTIRRALGQPSTPGTKVAELWFGTHEQGSSCLDSPDGTPLREEAGDMTMLVKLLACAAPLSLQTHPTREQAREGFTREEALGIPRDAPHRMYRDSSDKPEMIVALSRFEALCGFAPIDNSIAFLQSFNWSTEADILATKGLGGYMEWALQLSTPPLLDHAPPWLQHLAHLYPTDPALRVAPLLNHVVLEKGQALSLPAGNLHAYLQGFGLEVMSSSDNVIRAGFTSKHIDVAELLKIVDTTPLLQPIVEMSDAREFPSPTSTFSVGDISTIDRHIDKHRIVYGVSRNATDGSNVPMPYFLKAGEAAGDEFVSGWVCTQF